MPVSHTQALKEIQTTTIDAASAVPRRIDGQRLPRLGLRVPNVRALLKAGYSFQSDASRTELIGIWDHVFKHAKHYEVAHQAIYYYQYRTLNRAEFNAVKQWIDHCDCWEQSDDLSKIYAQVFEEQPTWVLPVYKQWNLDKNPWRRRQSIVGLLEYAQKRQRYPSYDVLISFVEVLLGDDDYYVQKGVGWTLREIYNLYPEETWQFLCRHAGSIPPGGYQAATEKLSKRDKVKINALRKRQKAALKKT